jgi:hypothetical protein
MDTLPDIITNQIYDYVLKKVKSKE